MFDGTLTGKETHFIGLEEKLSHHMTLFVNRSSDNDRCQPRKQANVAGLR